MTPPPPRTAQQRRRDTLHRPEDDVVTVEGTGHAVEVTAEEGDLFARRTSFDPRTARPSSA